MRKKLIENKYISINENNISVKLSDNSLIRHNNKFIKESLIKYEKYFDNLYFDINKDIVLDNYQRKAILTDEDYNLIIAGAGSGKTTVIIGKIKYLIDKCNIKEDEILVLSFALKNTKELKDKLNNKLNINCNISTFHKLGLDLIKQNTSSKPLIINDCKKKTILYEYFNSILYKDIKKMYEMTYFLSFYFNIGNNMDKYTSLNNFIESVYNKDLNNYKAIIENFLKIRNIDYIKFKGYIVNLNDKVVYRGLYKVKTSSRVIIIVCNKRKVNVSSINNQMTADIILINNIYDIKNLIKELDKKIKNVVGDSSIINNKDQSIKYFRTYTNKVIEFISKMKSSNIDIKDLEVYYYRCKNREKAFLRTLIPIIKYYDKYLEDENAIDFDTMINKATSITNNEFLYNNKIKYIIVDEYQDISNNRLSLIKNLILKFNCKLIAVGDDWQSIYGFTGSNITLFTNFIEVFGYGKVLKIPNTYRNSSELIDVASKFILKDKLSINKKLTSNKHITKPIVIIKYKDLLDKVNKLIEIIEQIKDTEILLLGRFSKDLDFIKQSKLFKQKGTYIMYKNKVKLRFITVHASKGLETDNVIIINAINDSYGFPAVIKNDPIFNIFDNTNDERRLFYVALTRTKNKVYILAPIDNYSIYIKEISKYKNVLVN